MLSGDGMAQRRQSVEHHSLFGKHRAPPKTHVADLIRHHLDQLRTYSAPPPPWGAGADITSFAQTAHRDASPEKVVVHDRHGARAGQVVMSPAPGHSLPSSSPTRKHSRAFGDDEDTSQSPPRA